MRALAVLLSLVIVAELVSAIGDASYAKDDEALRKQLFKDYNKLSLPNKKSIVTFTGIHVTALRIDEEDQKMVLQGWLKYNWQDPRFQWEAHEHSDIQMLGVDTTEIWTPDIAMYNSATAKDTTNASPVLAIAYSSGKMLHVPAYDFAASCSLDLTYWPHDKHNCSLKLGSWIHSGLVLELALDNYEVDVKFMTNISEFTLLDWNVKVDSNFYPCCEEPYMSFTTFFVWQRSATAYNWTIKLPIICLCLLTIVLFLTPPDAGEKVVFGGICVLLDFLYLQFVVQQISHAPTHTPLIVQLLCQQLVLVLASVFVSTVVLRMARSPHSQDLPPSIRGPILMLARFLFLGNYIKPDSKSKSEEAELEAGSGAKLKSMTLIANEWVVLSAILDRLALLLYLAVCIITLIRFSVIL